MKKYIFCFLLQILAVSFALAQKQVAGEVVDSTGSPIAGATVMEKGLPSNGTATNSEGRFQLILKGNTNTIIVNAIGFVNKEIAVRNQTNLLVNMTASDAKGIDEVVVVGYGRQKKITVTGAVSSVSGEEIRRNPAASLQNTLAGRLPGFFSRQPSGRPGADGAQFFIRGQSSYNGSGANNPLIIVDDIEFTYDQFSRLDPNEIETISILKDASTTAVYGIMGANGVVVITTRRGKIGPPKISLRAETSLAQPTRLPTYLDAYQSASLFNQAQINDNEINPSPTFKTRFSNDDLELYRNGQDPYGHPNVNWKEVLFKKFSRQMRGNLDIAGGTEKVRYFVSVGYLFQDGMLKNYSKNQDVNNNYYHQRYNYRSNLDMKLTKDLDMRLDLYGNVGEINNPNFGSPWGYNDLFYDYSSFLTLAPFAYPVYNPNGTFGYSKWQLNENPGGGSYNANNVVGRLTHYGYSRNFENNMNLVASATQRLHFITKGLSVKGTVSYASNHTYTRSMTRDAFPSFIYDPVAGTYEPRDPNLFRVRRFFLGYSPGSTVRTVNFQAMLNYDRTFGAHHVYALALVNQNSVVRANSNNVYNFIPSNFRGLTGRIGYDYKQKYLLEFNSAYNGSDRFYEDKRYGFFPAVSAGWNISEESFFKDNIDFISRLKFRGSYGLVGSANIGSFSYYYLQTYGNSNGSGQLSGFPASFGVQHNGYTGMQEGRLSNLDVTWEKEKKFDLGVDFGLFENKLTGTFEYFNNNRFDILTERGTVSAVFGQALPPVNLGEVNNKGYEAELAYNGKVGKNFSFNLKGTYSVAKNKILYRDEPTPLHSYQAFTGNSIGQQLVYKWIGFYKDKADIDNSPAHQSARPGDLKYADLNKDGVINQFDMMVTGYPNDPNTILGFQLGLQYKGFSLSTFFQGGQNFNVRAVAEAIRAFGSNLMEIHTKAWTPELGDNAQYPRLSHTGGVSDPLSNPSTFWHVRGDYIRLKTAELAYTLPSSLTGKLGLDNVRIYTNGYNLVTWTKIDERYEFDPEINSGTDRSLYPPQRMYNFGLSITF